MPDFGETRQLALVLVQDPFTAALIAAVGFVLIIRFLDLWEREPLWLLALMGLWGAVGATAIALPGNQAVIGLLSPPVQVVWGPAIAAPIVEESGKGLALVVAFGVSRWAGRRYGVTQFDGVTDGIVYGAAVGLGFAFVENNFFTLNEAQASNIGAGLELLQLREGFFNLGMLGHAVYTGAFGAGLGLATWSRSTGARVVFPLLGLGVAMIMHAVNNGLLSFMLIASFGFDTTAVALAGGRLPTELISQLRAVSDSALIAIDVFGYVTAGLFLIAMILWTNYQRRVLAFELAEEVTSGVLSRAAWELASRYDRRLYWYLRLVLSGHLVEWRGARHYYQAVAKLAFAKWRLRKGVADPSEVVRRREEVIRLGGERSGLPAEGAAS